MRNYRPTKNRLISIYGVSESRATSVVKEAGGEILRVHRKSTESSRAQSLLIFVTKSDGKEN